MSTLPRVDGDWCIVRQWMAEWYSLSSASRTPVLLVAGKTGVGKSTGVCQIASETGHDALVLDASMLFEKNFVATTLRPTLGTTTVDVTSSDLFVNMGEVTSKGVATAATALRRRLVLIEDIDAYSSNDGAAVMMQVTRALKASMVPVVVTCIDACHPIVARLGTMSTMAFVERPSLVQLHSILHPTRIDLDTTRILTRACNGDLHRLGHLVDEVAHQRRLGNLPTLGVSVTERRRRLEQFVKRTRTDESMPLEETVARLLDRLEWQHGGGHSDTFHFDPSEASHVGAMLFENYIEAVRDDDNDMRRLATAAEHLSCINHPDIHDDVAASMLLLPAFLARGRRPLSVSAPRVFARRTARFLETLEYTQPLPASEHRREFRSVPRLDRLDCALQMSVTAVTRMTMGGGASTLDDDEVVEHVRNVLYSVGVYRAEYATCARLRPPLRIAERQHPGDTVTAAPAMVFTKSLALRPEIQANTSLSSGCVDNHADVSYEQSVMAAFDRL